MAVFRSGKGPWGPFRPPALRYSRYDDGFPLAPTVTAVTPNYDRIVGGSAITITGTGFLAGTVVTIGGVLCTSIVVVDAQTITAIAPANPEGTDDLVVTRLDGLSVTLPLAFTYIASHIISVSPARGLSSGGQTVLITGANFVTGSTIDFGGAAATNVIFVDSTRYYCTTPAHADGYVDVTITEPSTATAIGRNAFAFTSVIFSEDIRRNPGVRVLSTLNRGVNTASFDIDGASVPPAVGEKVILTDDDTLIFAGLVQNVIQKIEDSKYNKVWTVSAVDYSQKFNRKRPFGVWNNVSATQVIKDLVAQFAPEFNSDFVQSGLPRISLILDGTKELVAVFQLIATSIGEGHFYLDYRKSVHFFTLQDLTGANANPNTALAAGPGTSMVVTQSTVNTMGRVFPPGWYYFFSSSFYEGHTAVGPNAKTYDAVTGTVVSTIATLGNASSVFVNYGQGGLPPSNQPLANQGYPLYILLSREAANRNLQGDISNGVYGSASRIQPRGWIGLYGDGSVVPDGAWTLADANTFYFASADVWTVLEQASGGATTPAVADFESALSPISNLIFLNGFLPTFGSIPVGATVGGRAATRRNIYAVRFGDPANGGGTGLLPYAHIDDNTTTSSTPNPYSSDAKFTITSIPTVAPPASPGVLPSLLETTTLNSALAFQNNNCQNGYWAVMVSCVYADGTESAGTIQSGPKLMGGTFQARIPNLPVGSPVNGVAVVFRKIYAAIYKPYHPTVVFGLPDFGQGSNLVYLVTDNTSTDVTFPLGTALVGGTSTNPGAPPLMKDINGNPILQLGPDLEDQTNPAAIDDNNDDLLLDPPIQATSDDSQLRNKILLVGRGSALASDVANGAVAIPVMDVGSFITPTGSGQAIQGHRRYTYASVSAASGAGSLLLNEPLVGAITQSDWTTGGNSPICPFVIVEDKAAQQARGSIETDDSGVPTDGIHEYTITDNNLTTYQQMVARGLAELKQFARPIVTVTYSTRDPLTRPGKVVHFDLTDPPVHGDFIIQEVNIDQFKDESSDQLHPRYNATADSAARFTFQDFMLSLADAAGVDGSGGGGNSASASIAGVLQTASVNTQAAVVAGTSIFSVSVPFNEDTIVSWNNLTTIVPGIPGAMIFLVAAVLAGSKTNSTSWSGGGNTLQIGAGGNAGALFFVYASIAWGLNLANLGDFGGWGEGASQGFNPLGNSTIGRPLSVKNNGAVSNAGPPNGTANGTITFYYVVVTR